jgi:hypothetical protein
MKITLTLYDNDDTNNRVYVPDWPAELCGVPGLCICKAALKDGDRFIPWERDYHRYWWHIVHAQSGIAVIPYLYSKSDAQAMAVKLVGPNWQVDEAYIKDNFDEYRVIVKAAKGDYFED